jgi:3-dehydro-L-gulonate 2-dehydrogenase
MEEFYRILSKHNFETGKAKQCAHIFTQNSLDGIYSHGVNRFARFVRYIRNGYIVIDAEPEMRLSAGAIEQWDGNMGPGPLNALFCTEQVLKLAKKFGIGCVTLANTNHWMRAGFYGWKAAKAGFVFISCRTGLRQLYSIWPCHSFHMVR